MQKERERKKKELSQAQDSLLRAAAAMAQSSLFRQKTEWLPKQDNPRLDRLKLGGIYHAQPFSHHLRKAIIISISLLNGHTSSGSSRSRNTSFFEMVE
jgi:hypothetical protein